MAETPRVERTRKPLLCPNCKKRNIAEIMYGMPANDPELWERVNAGKVLLGGCCILGDEPAWCCTDCDQPIFRKAKTNTKHADEGKLGD